MIIFPIHAFKDNYIWTWIDPESQEAWIVDPGDANPVKETLEKEQVDLAGILLTHHHRDHSGGIHELLKQWPHARVWGSHKSPIVEITDYVREGDVVECGGAKFKVLEIPGHTLDHIAFYGSMPRFSETQQLEANSPILFCGDTLFSAGCGRVFEGTPPQMYQSLQKLEQLDPQTQIFCGHEYTQSNLAFAQTVEPCNSQITEKIREVNHLRQNNLSTLPSTMQMEKLINPFLRCTELDVIRAAEGVAKRKLNTPEEVFAVLREWKNVM